MLCTSAPRRVLRRLEGGEFKNRRGKRDGEYIPEGHLWPQASFCSHGISQGNREQIYERVPSDLSRKNHLGLPSRTPQDIRDVDSAIHMAPCTVGMVPSMAYRMCDDYNAVDTLADISDCMNDRRNKEGHTGVGI